MRNRPNHALQRTRPSHHCCNRGVSWAGSLTLDVRRFSRPHFMTDIATDPLPFLRRALKACGAILRIGRGIQEPTRAKLTKDLLRVCTNCRSAHESFLKHIQSVKDALADPPKLAKEAQRFASSPKPRQAFKPERLCGEVISLLTRIRSNLDPLKYSVAVNRIGTLEKQFKAFHGYDNAFYEAFDAFASDISKDAIDLQLALAASNNAQVTKLQKRIRRRIETMETNISKTLQQVVSTHSEVQF